MTDTTDHVGKWEFPEDGFTDIQIGLSDDELTTTRVHHTTLKRTAVEFHGGSAEHAFEIAAAWFRAHPNARPVTIRPDYRSKWGYMTDSLCNLLVDVSWVSPDDVKGEYES